MITKTGSVRIVRLLAACNWRLKPLVEPDLWSLMLWDLVNMVAECEL